MKYQHQFFMACLALLGVLMPVTAAAQLSGLPIYGFEQAQPAPPVPGDGNVQPVQDAPAATPIELPQQEDYDRNEASRVFGSQLFTGAFANQAATDFNADYAINVGDTINVRLWGGYNFQAPLTVDAQGNIFLPNVGPVNLLGVRNADLQRRVEQAVSTVFRSNVSVYASLAAAQPVRVFVSGFVNRPGAYAGTSMDSILHYLDQAGGIDPDRGSFLQVEVKRGNYVRARINLYDFLLYGNMPQVQLANGDVIFVSARQSITDVSGLAENANIFEFGGAEISLAQLSEFARPKPDATHVRVTRSAGPVRNTEYYALADAASVFIADGDRVAFTADKRPGTISVRVEGEHDGQQEFVLPYGSRLGDVMAQIAFNERSAAHNIQLFRTSVRDRQKEALDTSLRALEKAALTARSGTSDEARLRKDEADLLLRFVDRASKVEPKGQVAIAQAAERSSLLLENGDVIVIPSRDGLVLVNGEVLFPNALAYNGSYRVEDYVEQAGGFTNKGSSRIVVLHQDGSYSQVSARSRDMVQAGDQIMVLPKIDTKGRQIFKELTQILYQVAVSAGVVLGL